MVKGNVEIKIIQGDYYQKNVIIENVEVEYIRGVYISCEKLNICQELTYDENLEKYKFVLQPNETKNLQDIRTDYDITIKFVDGKVKTASYRGAIVVLPKRNEVGCINND